MVLTEGLTRGMDTPGRWRSAARLCAHERQVGGTRLSARHGVAGNLLAEPGESLRGLSFVTAPGSVDTTSLDETAAWEVKARREVAE